MNSLALICKPRMVYGSLTAVTALNGGATLDPYVGSFVWNGVTYSQMFAFTATSGTTSINVSSTKTCGILLVGGGGGGGCTNWNTGEGAGGGAGGGVIYGTVSLNGSTTYTITVGAKGNKCIASTNANAGPGNAVVGTNGGNTSISGTGVSETAYGGGFGGYSNGSPDSTANSGRNGGCGGGSMKPGGLAGTVAGTTNMSAGNCSASTNSRSLTYSGFNGGAGVQSGCGGGGGGATAVGGAGSTTNNAVAGLGGTGFLFSITGDSNTYTGKYYATGGCGGARSTLQVPNQSSIVAVGGVVGGTQSKPVPDDPVTYGTGGSAGWGAYGLSGNLSNNSGANGNQGICIILVP